MYCDNIYFQNIKNNEYLMKNYLKTREFFLIICDLYFSICIRQKYNRFIYFSNQLLNKLNCNT